MATTPKGIYYPNDYNEIADIPEDMKKMAESIDEVFENTDSDLSDIKEEQTTQNDNIQTNSNNISDLQSNKADKNEIPTDLSQLSNDNTKFVNETGLENAISQEKTQRQNADNNLQNQVDTNKTNIQTNATNIATNTQEINTIKAEQTTQNNRLNNLETDNTTNKDNISANTQEINNIKSEQTTQNTNISTNATNIESLQEENENLKKIVSQLPQVTGQGTEVTLENTIEATFTKFDVEGNSVQDGTPSPDNEVPIKSAGDNENLLPNNIISQTKNGVAITKNNDGTLTFNGTSTEGFVLQVGTVTIGEDGEYTLSGCPSGGSLQSYFIYNMAGTPDVTDKGNGKTKALNKNDYLNMYINIRANQTFNDLVFKPKLEKGNKASGYSPYGMGSINQKIKNADGTEEQDYSIFVQQPMMDDDHFDRKNNKEVHTWIKYVLDGSNDENWSIRNNKFFINDNVNYNSWERVISPNGKSNIGVVSYSVLDNQTGFGLALAYGLRLNLENIDASNGGTIEQLRAYLAEHPITIYVKLKDSAYENLPCTSEQVEQLENKPSTYKDFTIIQSEDETPAYLEVSGIRDINTMFDKVTNAIVSLGGNV